MKELGVGNCASIIITIIIIKLFIFIAAPKKAKKI